MNETVAYGRVSLGEQNLDLQREAFAAEGIPENMQFFDIDSGRMRDRPGLKEALKYCGEDGMLVVWKLDRLGRNTAELIKTVSRLHERGVSFRCITQTELNTDSKLIFTILEQFERDQLAERTRAGIAAARTSGKRFGKPTFEELYVATGKVAAFQTALKDGMSVKDALVKLNIKRPTYIKWRHVFIDQPVDDIGLE